MTQPRFFTDENIEVAVAAGGARRGVDVRSARDLGRLRFSDDDHAFCRSEGLVLVTHDGGFRVRHWAGAEHAGIVYIPKGTSIGVMIEWIELIAHAYSAEEMIGRLESVS